MVSNALRRRTFTLASGAALAAGSRGAWAQAVAWSAGTEKPRTAAPPGATDCHHFIFDSRYPPAPASRLRPGEALPDEYRDLQARLGTTRHVVVQPSTYGTDTRLMLAALLDFGPDARGVAVVTPGVSDDALKRMNEAGVRGVRFNLVEPGRTSLDMVRPLAERVASLGWLVQILMLGTQIAEHQDMLAQLPCPVLFDHFGRIPQPGGVESPGFVALRRLLDGGRAWVKLSAPYQDSKFGPPTYADVGTVARAFIQAAPERLVWATDWPHGTEQIKPDDALLFDLLADWAPDPAVRDRILVANPAALFGFPPV